MTRAGLSMAVAASMALSTAVAGQPVREIRDVKAEFHEHCSTGERIGIRLKDASTVRGTLTQCQSDRLEIAAEPTNRVRSVRYAEVAALLDPDTGTTIGTVVAPPRKGLNRDGKILVGIGVGLAALVALAYLSGAFANP